MNDISTVDTLLMLCDFRKFQTTSTSTVYDSVSFLPIF